MKWSIATLSAIIIFVLIMALIFGFNALMSKHIEKWKNLDFALGIFPKLLVSLHASLSKYILVIVPFLFILCLAGAFITVARKK